MDEHNKKVRELKKGDIIRYIGSKENIVIEEIYFLTDDDFDIRYTDGNRVIINGLYWYTHDVVIFKSN